MKEIAVFGAGGHAKVVLDILERQGKYCVKAIVDSKDQVDFAKSGITAGVVAIGDNWLRAQVVAKILGQNPAFEFITAIHPFSSISVTTKIGPGSVVMAGAVVNSDTVIGRHCIVNTGANVDHDNRLLDYASLGPGAVLGGTVSVGTMSAVALGAKVAHGVTIGDDVVIGAGSVVLEDVPDRVVAFGTPCAVQRTRVAGDKYL